MVIWGEKGRLVSPFFIAITLQRSCLHTYTQKTHRLDRYLSVSSRFCVFIARLDIYLILP